MIAISLDENSYCEISKEITGRKVFFQLVPTVDL